MYGLGLLVSPFVATAVASHGGDRRWTLFYLFPGGLSVGNAVLVVAAFRETIKLLPESGESEGDENGVGERMGAMSEVKEMLKLKNLWIFSLFFFFYLGACFTSAGAYCSLLFRYPSHSN
jgi:MFS family permease